MVRFHLVPPMFHHLIPLMKVGDKGESTANNSNHLTALMSGPTNIKFALSRKSRGTPRQSLASRVVPARLLKCVIINEAQEGSP